MIFIMREGDAAASDNGTVACIQFYHLIAIIEVRGDCDCRTLFRAEANDIAVCSVMANASVRVNDFLFSTDKCRVVETDGS